MERDKDFESPLERPSILSFMIVALLLGTDIGGRLANGASKGDVAFEFAAFALTFLILGAKFISLTQIFLDPNLSEEERARSKQEREAWNLRAAAPLRELTSEIEEQFRIWELTPDESELCLLLLSGLRVEEVRELEHSAGTSFAALSASLYQKAGVGSRKELLGFFFSSFAEVQVPREVPGDAPEATPEVQGELQLPDHPRG